MPSILAAADENINPLHNAFVSPLRQSKQNDSSILAEIKNTMESPPKTTTTTTSLDSIASSCVSLKRKRPPKIQIPSVLREIPSAKIRSRSSNNVEDTTSTTTTTMEFSGSGVGVFSLKGKKTVMEDTYKVVMDVNGDPKKGFFGVYDGHGGRKAADFVADKLHENILGELHNCEVDLRKEDAVKSGYLKTDEEFLKKGLSSGACCVTCLIGEKDIVVSNLGDCRAVLCRGGVAIALTKDHTAEQEDERSRIEKKGGYVEMHRGAWRVHGILSVSRSIGDVHLKDWVLAEPDTKILSLTPDMEFLVLASDGLWIKVDNQEAIDTVMRVCLVPNKLGSQCNLWKEDDQFGSENTSPPSKTRRISSVKQQKKTQSPCHERSIYQKRSTQGALLSACKELVNLALTRGSMDDITVMIIDLGHFQCSN